MLMFVIYATCVKIIQQIMKDVNMIMITGQVSENTASLKDHKDFTGKIFHDTVIIETVPG